MVRAHYKVIVEVGVPSCVEKIGCSGDLDAGRIEGGSWGLDEDCLKLECSCVALFYTYFACLGKEAYLPSSFCY